MDMRWVWATSVVDLGGFGSWIEGDWDGPVRQMLWVAIGMAFYCPKNEWVDHMFRCLFVGNKLSVGYVDRASYVQKGLELHASMKSALIQAMSRLSLFWIAAILPCFDFSVGPYAEEAGVYSTQ